MKDIGGGRARRNPLTLGLDLDPTIAADDATKDQTGDDN